MSKTLLFISEIRKDSAGECQSILSSWQPHEVAIIQDQLHVNLPKTWGAWRGAWPWRQPMKSDLSSGSTISNESLRYEDASLELGGMPMLYFSHMDLGFIKPSRIDSDILRVCCKSGWSRYLLQSSSAWPSTHVQCVCLNPTSTLLFEKIYVCEAGESKSEYGLIRRKYALRDRHIPREKTFTEALDWENLTLNYFLQGLL